jgi:hypothetical protein
MLIIKQLIFLALDMKGATISSVVTVYKESSIFELFDGQTRSFFKRLSNLGRSFASVQAPTVQINENKNIQSTQTTFEFESYFSA